MNHFKFSEFDSPDLPNSGRDYMNREFLPIGPCGKVKGRDCKCD